MFIGVLFASYTLAANPWTRASFFIYGSAVPGLAVRDIEAKDVVEVVHQVEVGATVGVVESCVCF